ncbi:Phosphatidylinositide phosphatase SAC2 OS=Danio rerio GN=inpp5f PE=3 SV=1 [Rhizoctonia solani AG-1 IB]|uniref:Phosphatidylinositide phosphatase SAC2 n=1 Tax=Thanatephorus cucumeris (strain AG1-IB / isolate 7/3/14) TaxID=1108050 RepID=A0A0B7F618_THACB|nr:Phosphatidylinositide phosphatase SAC2 OS=Danio rerio GN=inpp5f PE=3 SV=1 [Rhizoctonia solani AG-1 IB]
MFAQLFNKRFSRQQQSPPPPPVQPPADLHPRAFNASAEGHLPLKLTAPPVPHPSPYARLILHASSEGLLVRPDVPSRQCASYVCVSWNGGGPGGAGVDVSLVTSKDGARWEGPVVYGVVGLITIYQESFLLVIADRKTSGTLFSPSRPVYTIKSIAAIPLHEDQARTALNGLLARKTPLTPRPLDTPAEDVPDLAVFPQTPVPSRSNTSSEPIPRVTFASEPIPIPNSEINASTTSLALSSGSLSASTSGTSTPLSSSGSLSGPAPVAKTLLNKLSFWSTPARATLDTTPALDTTPQEGETEPEQVLQKILASESTRAPGSAEERNKELTKKVVREVVRQFGSGCMYYSLDFDLATSLQDKHEQATRAQKETMILDDITQPPKLRRNSSSSNSSASRRRPSLSVHTDSGGVPIRADAFAENHALLPLWLRVPQKSRRFWWNEVLAAPFVEAGAHAYVVPILQGHFQSAAFDLGDDTDNGHPQVVEYALISRRSRDRAGLRYQRRGIDDDAHVANFVETEGLVRSTRMGSDNVFSYMQIRGSIPLFWSQPGLSLKPPPKLDRSVEEALPSARQHLQSCSRTCTSDGKPSPVTCVNLVEKGGREGVVGSGFDELVKTMGEDDINIVHFDFHAETKGMKYENISKLIDQLERTFEAQGFFWVRDGEVMARQHGVFRTNCIDCLDRTNVVQSAFARCVMNRQLQAVALVKPTDIEADMVFNDVWANNGDAVSRAYAGTSALKGDFTRTGRRDLGGMLNDGRNSIARMVTSNFGDYFAQATIDFMLGHRTTSVFSEFLLQLSSTDPREILKVSKIRASAIETTASRVLLENEHCVNAWTLLSPVDVGVTVSDKFVEKILLLSNSAIYIVCFDYEMDKVVSSRRVPLGDVVNIKQGAYILSTLHEASKDPAENYGFSITYHITHQDIRLTTYSMRNRPALPPPSINTVLGEEPPKEQTATQQAQVAMMPLLRRASSVRRGAGMLSQLLSASAPPPSPIGAPSDLETVSFKALPVLDVHPDQIGVAPLTSRDAARRVVREVAAGCRNAGAGQETGFIIEEDIVSLEQAQRITPVWAQLEYSFKRFLWLGS